MTNPHYTDIPIEGSSEDYRARSVEDEWANILRKYTDDLPDEEATDDQIQRILRALQSPPALALGAPTRDQIDSTTRAAIDELDFVKHGPADNETEAEQITKKLKQALKNGLHGDRVGPSSLMEPYELQAEPDRIVPTEEDAPPASGAADVANPPRQMTDNNTNDDSGTDNDQAEPDPGERIAVEPGEIDPQADANPGAPGGAQAAGAAQPANDADDAGAPDDQVSLEEIEAHDFIAEQVVGMMADEEGLSEEQKQVAYTAARVALNNHQTFLRDHLLSGVDENAREIIFESAVVEPIEDDIKQLIREQ